jgi:hypothetical protein
MPEITTKKTFGGATVAHISPLPLESGPKAINVVLSFEEALKLHLSLGQLLGKLNGYNRRSRAGRRTAANLCIYLHRKRLTVNEGRLRDDETADASEQAETSSAERS